MNSEEKPKLLVFAGPNGSGKSSVTEYYDRPLLYINADEIQKEQKIDSYQAAQEAEKLRELAIRNRQSFTMETVLSTPRNINLMKNAKNAGYEIELVYIITQSPKINVERVYNRVKEGGHDVPREKIISRYEKCLELFPEAFKIADKAKVYNNSFEFPVLLVEKNLDKSIILYPQKSPSEWDEQKIRKLVGLENLKLNNLDKYDISQAPAIKDLPEKADDKILFNAYAKAVLAETGEIWTDKTNQLIAIKMLKNRKISSDQVKRALKHSPEKIDNISLFVRKLENTPKIKAMRKTSKEMEM